MMARVTYYATLFYVSIMTIGYTMVIASQG